MVEISVCVITKTICHKERMLSDASPYCDVRLPPRVIIVLAAEPGTIKRADGP